MRAIEDVVETGLLAASLPGVAVGVRAAVATGIFGVGPDATATVTASAARATVRDIASRQARPTPASGFPGTSGFHEPISPTPGENPQDALRSAR